MRPKARRLAHVQRNLPPPRLTRDFPGLCSFHAHAIHHAAVMEISNTHSRTAY